MGGSYLNTNDISRYTRYFALNENMSVLSWRNATRSALTGIVPILGDPSQSSLLRNRRAKIAIQESVQVQEQPQVSSQG